MKTGQGENGAPGKHGPGVMVTTLSLVERIAPLAVISCADVPDDPKTLVTE